MSINTPAEHVASLMLGKTEEVRKHKESIVNSVVSYAKFFLDLEKEIYQTMGEPDTPKIKGLISETCKRGPS